MINRERLYNARGRNVHYSCVFSTLTPGPIPIYDVDRPGHCKNLKNDWEKSASALKGVVGVAAVDATASQSLASKYGIQVRPSFQKYLKTCVPRSWRSYHSNPAAAAAAAAFYTSPILASISCFRRIASSGNGCLSIHSCWSHPRTSIEPAFRATLTDMATLVCSDSLVLPAGLTWTISYF